MFYKLNMAPLPFSGLTFIEFHDSFMIEFQLPISRGQQVCIERYQEVNLLPEGVEDATGLEKDGPRGVGLHIPLYPVTNGIV